ncbi:hypothetical protein BC833DRAFT_624115 [Globomyces pollinis-pini]|nr:hypothetical protein BC833DRAFT_624115 [Globomyces pollinis-pini]
MSLKEQELLQKPEQILVNWVHSCLDILTTTKIRSSLPLQILIDLHGYFYGFFWIATLLLLCYKGNVFEYSGASFQLEVLLLFPWLVIEVCRLFLGSRGNKLEELSPTIIFVVLTFFSLIIYFFFVIWQSLLFDTILGAIGLMLTISELITGVLLIVNLKSTN